MTAFQVTRTAPAWMRRRMRHPGGSTVNQAQGVAGLVPEIEVAATVNQMNYDEMEQAGSATEMWSEMSGLLSVHTRASA